jgi:hypothetical protein
MEEIWRGLKKVKNGFLFTALVSLFICHDLHHATAGMVNMVKYDGFKPNFTPNPNTNNKTG